MGDATVFHGDERFASLLFVVSAVRPDQAPPPSWCHGAFGQMCFVAVRVRLRRHVFSRCTCTHVFACVVWQRCCGCDRPQAWRLGARKRTLQGTHAWSFATVTERVLMFS